MYAYIVSPFASTIPKPRLCSRRGTESSNVKVLIGFTLVETLVAMAVLLAVLVGPITLIAHGLFSASFSRNRLIASNLAQEGIELVRAVRDNNMLCIALGPTPNNTSGWDNNPSGPPPKLLDYFEIEAFDVQVLTCGGFSIQTPRPIRRNASTCNTPIRINSNGIYTYTSGTPTGFTRCVQVCSPPNAAPCSTVADADIPNNDQMEIISTVSWMEHGSPKNITLRDRLYRWQ